MVKGPSVASLSKEDVRKLVESAISVRDRILIKMLYYTGVRREEVCNLGVEDVDLLKPQIAIQQSRARTVPIPKDLARDLRTLIGHRKSGPVFVSHRGSKIAPRTINYVVAQAGKRAGIKNPNPQRRNITPQLLRHTFAHHYLRHEGEIQRLAYILGHSSVSTTYSAYGRPSQEGIVGEYEGIVQEMEV
jgi:integrase